MTTPEERLDEIEQEIAREADALGLDGRARREFVFFGLVAAAAATVGAGRAARGQAPGQAPATAPAPVERFPLGNGDPISWTFQPYPGGTGALMERLIRERGARAF